MTPITHTGERRGADAAASASFITSKKVGGLRFVRVGRLSLSFCIVRRAATVRAPRSSALTIIEPRLRSVVMPGGGRALVLA